MRNPDRSFPRFSPVGDSALLVELGDQISLDVNHKIWTLDAHLQAAPPAGVVEWVPGYTSLLVCYDPMMVKAPAIQRWLAGELQSISYGAGPTPKKIELPVRYGGANGPDLAYVAEYCGMSIRDVVVKHTARVYRVGMMGFTPGFAYLLGLDPDLATPRRADPRTFVPAGSVGIAGMQTGVYPLDSPGGWQLIGRTEQVLFDPARDSPFLLSPGDEVQFIVLEENTFS